MTAVASGARALLEARDLRAAYGSVEVLHGIDLAVAPGGVHAVLGANGAGKSTLLHVIAGQHPARAGSVMLTGQRIDGLGAHRLARLGLCLIPEGRGVFPNLTVRENLWMMTHRGQDRSAVEAMTFERFPRLGERRNQVAGTMSGGEQQMLALARGLATDPALLLIDELSMGLAPIIVEQLYGVVIDVAATGVSIVIVEQFARLVLEIADRATLMAHGHVVREGTPSEVESNLMEDYLGA